MTRRAVWLIEAGVFLTLSIPIAILPLKLSSKVGEMLGLLLFYLWKSRRKIAMDNLTKSVSAHALVISEPVEKIIKANFKNLGKSFVEVIKIYFGLGRKIIDSVSVEGMEYFQSAQKKGKGILFITGHCGNWELLAIASSVRLSGISVVARPINNPYINSLAENVRKRHGNSVIYKRGALKTIMQTMKNNGCVGILMDQAVIPEEGYVIDFLGRGAWTTKIPALIARKTGAAVLPAFIYRTGNAHTIKIFPEIVLSDNTDIKKTVKKDTQKFSGFIEQYIKEHPTEWLWIHRRWKRVKP